jgi:hypothetical protein
MRYPAIEPDVTVQLPVNEVVVVGVAVEPVVGLVVAVGVALRPSCAGAERNPEK